MLNRNLKFETKKETIFKLSMLSKNGNEMELTNKDSRKLIETFNDGYAQLGWIPKKIEEIEITLIVQYV